ncbi:MAG: hypothetical protein ABI459_03255 [Deltaproteobacteria bacterium]
MTSASQIVFDPLLPWLWIAILSALVAGVVFIGLWRGMSGWWLRPLGGAALIIALTNPSLQRTDRDVLSDIIIAVVDESASQKLSDRPAQTEAALARLQAAVAALGNTELRIIRTGDAPDNQGTLVMGALQRAVAEEPRDRLAGVVIISDGHIHDAEAVPDLPAPLHVLLTGHPRDWDRRLVLVNAPSFAVVGEDSSMTVRIEDQGLAPRSDTAQLAISVDGGEPRLYDVPMGQDMVLPLKLERGGMNIIRFETPTLDGELTDRNNAAIVQINGVRDRLRVLLVSGEPHAGERTWRNLLKSDSSVDLVHFTILRPPEKQDNVPVSELSLIAFPTRELFVEKINEFDLIVFDRYSQRGLLPASYFDNIREYVEQGGAVLVAAGPEFASVESLSHSPFGIAIPAVPTALVRDAPFRPEITAEGHRHPVTEGLEAGYPPREGETGPGWGKWFRQIDVEPTGGNVLMSGIDGKPLLILDRVGEGRVALLASDQAWLWSRGYDGGGPQLELLRRLAHWMMKEPELEEESLTAAAAGEKLTITRRTLSDTPQSVEITGPSGQVITLPLEEVEPGKYQVVYDAPELGLYRLHQDDLDAVTAVGPASPKEFEQTVASGELMKAAVAPSGGGIVALDPANFDLRRVAAGRPAAGRGWIGITPRNAFVAADVQLLPLIWPLLALVIAAALIIGGWLREGRE